MLLTVGVEKVKVDKMKVPCVCSGRVVTLMLEHLMKSFDGEVED